MLDQETGALISQSALDPGFWADSASDPLLSRSLIWGISNNNDLMEVDPARGVLLRSVTLYRENATLETIQGLAIDPISGHFFGASIDSLYEIDPNSGATTLIGNTPVRINKGMGFDANGVLYAIADSHELVSVDVSTAAITDVATLDVQDVEDLAARPEDGVMFGLADTTEGYQLITIDTSSGAVELVGNSVGRPSHLAFTNVPEPRALILAVFAFAVFALTARHPATNLGAAIRWP